MAEALKLVTKLTTKSERKTRTTQDTIMVTPRSVEAWRPGPVQRPIHVNAKVLAAIEQLKVDGGVWRGVVTLGILDGVTYCVDGGHRKYIFLQSGLPEGYVDVRICHFESMAEMGEEFDELNSHLVNMRPDDHLRALEASLPALAEIRSRCPFVGYDQLRRGPSSPMVGMSQILRAWRSSDGDTPAGQKSGMAARDVARSFTDAEVAPLASFLNMAFEAFGRDVEYQRLWGTLNITLCMWLFRRMVLPPTQHNPNARAIHISREQFKKCLMSLSADGHYLDWLVGRVMSDRDRSPAYSHIRSIFAARLRADMPEANPKMPQPAWCSSAKASYRAAV